MLSLKHFFDPKKTINDMAVKPKINLKSAFDIIKAQPVKTNNKKYLNTQQQNSLKVIDKADNVAPKIINLKNSEPDVINFKNNERKIMNLKNSEPDIINIKNNEPELLKSKNSEPDVINSKNIERKIMNLKNSEPDVINSKNIERKIMNLKNSEPNVKNNESELLKCKEENDLLRLSLVIAAVESSSSYLSIPAVSAPKTNTLNAAKAAAILSHQIAEKMEQSELKIKALKLCQSAFEAVPNE